MNFDVAPSEDQANRTASTVADMHRLAPMIRNSALQQDPDRATVVTMSFAGTLNFARLWLYYTGRRRPVAFTQQGSRAPYE